LAILFLSWTATAYGASVTIIPRPSPSDPGVQLKTQYGYLNATVPEAFNSFTVYPNGTIFFDVTFPTATQQGTYIFQTKSYGNGTMQLRFLGPIPVRVTGTPATSTYSPTANWQQITYTASQTSQLTVFYAPILNFGVVNGSIFFNIIVITSGIMYVSMFFGIVMRLFTKDNTLFLADPKLIIVSGIAGTVGFLFILVVGANLIHPACPVGYTCNG
jgi:hypothetical protein